jgi:3-oxoacyl-[acyl-carrier-protein] synthase-3
MKARLEQVSMANFLGVIKDAVSRSEAKLEDISYIALLHMKRSAHHHILEALGLAEDQSIYLEDYGHLGQLDQILSLELAQEAGKLNSGDLVVLVAAGIGYVWNAICLRWGEHNR